MRRIFPSSLVALVLATATVPAFAQTSVIDRPPMDLGADQAGTIRQMGVDLLEPVHEINWWFDAGMTWPTGTLEDRNIDPGLLLRVNHQIWRDDALGLVGSVATFWGNDSYFNDANNDFAFQVPPGDHTQFIQSHYYVAAPMMLELQIAPPISDAIRPIFSLGPGVVWSHESIVTSAVSDGVGSVSLGGGTANDSLSVLVHGPGGEQGISPVAIRTLTQFNLGWQAKAGLGFRLTSDQNPLWMRIMASGTTYYDHTSPRTLFGFVASFGR